MSDDLQAMQDTVNSSPGLLCELNKLSGTFASMRSTISVSISLLNRLSDEMNRGEAAARDIIYMSEPAYEQCTRVQPEIQHAAATPPKQRKNKAKAAEVGATVSPSEKQEVKVRKARKIRVSVIPVKEEVV